MQTHVLQPSERTYLAVDGSGSDADDRSPRRSPIPASNTSPGGEIALPRKPRDTQARAQCRATRSSRLMERTKRDQRQQPAAPRAIASRRLHANQRATTARNRV